jgi:hypothetical protein
MEQLAREAATKVVEQPHYWREGQLTISKSDLVTDITYEVKKVLVDLFMKGMGMAPMNGSASE